MADYDIVIRNGRIIDGTGAAGYDGDLAIKDGLIAAIGKIAGSGAEEIDAKGHLVTPGFVDIHTHYDGQAIWDSQLAPSSLHGVTTAVMGNCGVGFAPVRAGDHDKLIQLMEGVEDIPAPALHEGLDFNWESFGDYLDALERRPRDIDICAQLPHAALRVYVMGERALRLEPANQADIAEMRALAEQAMRAGAFGFTTSRTISHKTLAGDPTPTLRAQEDELLGIALGLRDAGSGQLEIVSDWNMPDAQTEFAMVRRLVEASGRPLVFSMGQRHDRPEAWHILMDLADQAAADGLKIRPVFPPRSIGILLGLEGSQNPFAGTPSYKTIAAKSLAERVAIMRDPGFRAQLLSEDRFVGSNFPLLPRLSFARMFGFTDPPNYAPPESASITAIAAASNRTPEEVAYDMLLEDDGRAFIFAPLVNYADYTLDASRAMMGHKNAIVGLSDGGAHVGFISDGSYPTFLLAYWGRDVAENPFPIEELVRRQTSDTAGAVGLDDRGTLAPGKKADVNIIDFAKLGLNFPTMRFDLPAGGRRLMQTARGYKATIKSGTVTYRDGAATGALPGKLVRGVATK
ncbi:MAG: amidohydrolase family protein [Acetobacteraceae bacterium]|nr:amidohydrolase family protein [Acetobacteraceae bacterium]